MAARLMNYSAVTYSRHRRKHTVKPSPTGSVLPLATGFELFRVRKTPSPTVDIFSRRRLDLEITSASTRSYDVNEKHQLYERLEVPEYWLFDPRGEWIPEQLRGFRLAGDTYVPITDSFSQQLNLRLSVEGALMGFYRGDTGEKLLPFTDLAARVQQLESELAQYRDRYGSLGESSPS